MPAEQDWIERFRLWLIPKLGHIALALEETTGENLYTSYEQGGEEFVARVEMGEEDFEKELEEMGFERNPLAALKKLKRTGETDEGSWRKVYPDEHPHKQLHIVLYDGSEEQDAETGETFVYGHWEYRWDTDPMKHYRAEDYDPEKGVEMMRDLLDEHEVEYDSTKP